MIYLNCCDEWDDSDIGHPNWLLYKRGWQKNQITRTGYGITHLNNEWEELNRLYDGAPSCWLFHGYKNPDRKAMKNYIKLEQRLKQSKPNMVVVGVFWPGGDLNVSFWKAQERTRTVADNINEFIVSRIKRSDSYMSCQTHSLGAMVALEMTKGVPDVWDRMMLSGAAVDHDVFTKKVYTPINTEIVVGFTEHDDVLKRAYRFQNFLKGKWFTPAMGLEGALIPLQPSHQTGFRGPIIRNFNYSEYVFGHSEYIHTHPYLDDFADFIGGPIESTTNTANQS